MTGRIAVIGGNSALGQALLTGPLAGAIAVVRGDPLGSAIVVPEYAMIGPALFAGIRTVINCVGVAHGSAADLMALNASLPLHLLRTAREGGVERFVHVSSFSVYGAAERIGAETALDPASDYGRSKLAGDRALLAEAENSIEVVCLRLPAIIDSRGKPTKLTKLVQLWCRTRLFPAPRGDVQRAMISREMAAEVLAKIAQNGEQGVLHAADPEPFNFGRAAHTLSEAAGRRIVAVPLPRAALLPLKYFAEESHRSLYRDSMLDPAENIAAMLPSNLFETLAEIGAAAVGRDVDSRASRA